MIDELQQTSASPSAEVSVPEVSPEVSAAVPAADAATAAKGAPARGARSFGNRPGGGPGGRGGRPGGGRTGGGRGGRFGGGRGGDVPAEADYEEKNIEIARVTRVTKGGKRMRFRALTVIGNRKGRAGFGLAKGVDVALATAKATSQARKSLLTVPLSGETIPHQVDAKFGAAHVLLKPAPRGSGIKAGGAVRIVLELAGVPNVVSKILGSSSKINNVKATFLALKKLRAPVTKIDALPVDGSTKSSEV